MGMEKAITSGKEHRKPFRGAKAVDATCRNHGSCPYCRSNRLHKSQAEKDRSDYLLKEKYDDEAGVT